MVVSGSILGPIIGAVISGVIGIIVVEYRNYRDEVAEVEQWYERTIRLAEQVKRETPESYLEICQKWQKPRRKRRNERRYDLCL